MPMVVYTEEEMIDAANKAAADAITDVAEQRDKAMRENTMIRKRVNNLREAMQECIDLLAERTYGSAARSPGHNARLRLEQALAQNSDAPASTAGTPDAAPGLQEVAGRETCGLADTKPPPRRPWASIG